MAGGLQSECPRANAWLTFLTFDLLIKIVILHALSMTNILLVTLLLIGVNVWAQSSWRSERSHSQVIKIEICAILPPGGSHKQLAVEWKVAGSSPAVELCFFVSLLFFFFFF